MGELEWANWGSSFFFESRGVTLCCVVFRYVSLFVVSYVVHIQHVHVHVCVHLCVEDIVLLSVLNTYLMYLAKWCS